MCAKLKKVTNFEWLWCSGILDIRSLARDLLCKHESEIIIIIITLCSNPLWLWSCWLSSFHACFDYWLRVTKIQFLSCSYKLLTGLPPISGHWCYILLRYALFCPLGTLIWRAIPLLDKSERFSFHLPNTFNFSFSFSWFLRVYLILMVAGGWYMMKHMYILRQRRYGRRKRKMR